MPSTLPLNEQTIRGTSGNTSFFYGFDVTLTQADVPYVIPAQGRPASRFHFVVCADTVRITSALVNPGMDIRINARQLIVERGALIDTGGADPETSYTPGAPAQQTVFTPGTIGAHGAAASGGRPSGNIVLRVGTMVGPALTGNVSVLAVADGPYKAALARACAPVSFTALSPTSIPDVSSPFMGSTLTISGLKLAGFGKQTIDVPDIDLRRGVATVVFASREMTFNGSVTLSSDLGTLRGNFSTSGFVLNFIASYTLDLATGTLTARPGGAMEFSGFAPRVDLKGGDLFALALNALVAGMEKQFQGLIAAAVTPGMNAAVQRVAAVVRATDPPDLVLSARGGAGGRGQDGHDGVGGKEGERGKDLNYEVMNDYEYDRGKPPPAETFGGPGGPGGQAGNAGRSGPGAGGGRVDVWVRRSSQRIIAFDVRGGPGGPAAVPGRPGYGGRGGEAGSFYVKRLPLGNFKAYSKGGKGGPMGGAAAITGAPGAPGANGALSFNGSTTVMPNYYYPTPGWHDLLSGTAVQQLTISQHAANFAFMNAASQEEVTAVLVVLEWLVNLASGLDQRGFTPPGWSAADVAATRTLAAAASTLMSNSRAGLDFYGKPRHWVPILTLNEYQRTLDTLIGAGKIIEDQYRTYVNEKKSQQERLAAIEAAAAQVENVMASLRTQIKSIEGSTGAPGQLQQVDQAIVSLSDQIQRQRTVIAGDESVFTRDFRMAVEQDTQCQITDVLNAVGSIIASAGPIATSMGELSEAFGKLDKAKTKVEGLKHGIAVITKVVATVGGIKSGIEGLGKLLPGPDPDAPVGLLAAKAEEFDALIDKYTDRFPSAVALKRSVHDYFDLINARNQAIVNYNGLFLTRLSLQQQIEQHQAQLQQLADARAQGQVDPALPGYISFMQGVYGAIKTAIVRLLYFENRAYFFWSLDEAPFATNDLTVASLAATHAQLVVSIADVKAQRQAEQPFTQEVTVTAAATPIAFASLAETKKLVVALPPDNPDFANYYRVIANSFTLRFPEVKDTSNRLFVNVRHSGTSVLRRPSDRASLEFTHLPRIAPFTIDYANPKNTSGGVLGSTEQGYAGVSPFTVWTLDFNFPQNAWLDLSRIKSVVITFTGTYAGPPGLRQAAPA